MPLIESESTRPGTLWAHEEYRPGHMRRLVIEKGSGAACLDICHRYTAEGVEPARWSLWERWGEFPDAETALNIHEWVRINGPWWKTGMPADWVRAEGSSSIDTTLMTYAENQDSRQSECPRA